MSANYIVLKDTSHPLKRRLCAFSALFLIIMITGCAGPKVVEFKVRPNHVCGGDRVNIT